MAARRRHINGGYTGFSYDTATVPLHWATIKRLLPRYAITVCRRTGYYC